MSPSTSQNHNLHSRFELRAILETSRLLAESHNIDFVLNNLLLITMGKLMIGRGLILLFKPKKNLYSVVKSKGRAALSEGESVVFEHFDEAIKHSVIVCPHNDISIPELFKNDDNYTLFNLQTRNNHIGFLCLGSKGDKKPLSKQETDFVEGLAIISAVAIANSRMFAELKHTNRRLDHKVYELNTLLDLSKDFNQMVKQEQIVRIFKFAMLGQMLIRRFFLVMEQNNERCLVATNNIKGSLNKKEIDTLFSQIANPVNVDKKLREELPFLKYEEIHALIPLYFQDQKMAVIGIGKRANNNPYSKADFKFLQSLGNLALLSIQKTLLLEERFEKERLEEELNIAKSIQQGLLPHPIPMHPALDIAAQNVSSEQVGGDYFDIVETPAKNMLFAIGDVTGKGTPAALLMANLQAILHVLLSVDISLEEATGRMNDVIYQNTPSDKFITFFWGIFDPQNFQFSYVNAGHNPPLYFKNTRSECELLEEGGLILGAISTLTSYEKSTITLENDDLIVFYTDGITEALNPGETEEYGEERLIRCINEHKNETSQQILDAVINDVKRYSGNIQYDDITVIVLKVK